MRLPKWNGGGNEPVVKTAGGAYAIGAETGGAGSCTEVTPSGGGGAVEDVDPAGGADAVRAGCTDAGPVEEDPTVHAGETATDARARDPTAAAEEAGAEALEVLTMSALGLEKKDPTLLVPIGGGCRAAGSTGRESKAASEAGR
jgi:hypothetical protein